MKHLLILFAFFLATTAVAQQAPAATAGRPPYGTAELSIAGLGGKRWEVVLRDGITPNPKGIPLQENGRNRVFEDEAAALNYLYEQGWEVLPNGVVTQPANTFIYRYLLKRRHP